MKKNKIPAALAVIFERVYQVMDDAISTVAMGKLISEEFPGYNSRDGYLPKWLETKCGKIGTRSFDKRLPPGKENPSRKPTPAALFQQPYSPVDLNSPGISDTAVWEQVERREIRISPAALQRFVEAHGYLLYENRPLPVKL